MSQLTSLRCFVLFATLLAAPGLLRAELPEADWKRLSEKAEGAAKRGEETEAGLALVDAARDDSERAAKLVVSVYGRLPGENEMLAERVYGALQHLRSDPATAVLKKELEKGKDARLRVLIVDALAERGRAQQDAIAKALEDKAEEVVRAAARALGKLRTKAAVLALCGAMEKLEAKGKTAATWQDCRNALLRTLGVDLQGGADYRNWFQANESRFVEGRGIPPEAKEAERGGKAEKGGARIGETTVFGTELYCKNVVLILDISGSMDITDPYPPGMDLGSLPREYAESNGMKDPDRNRMRRARKELVKLLEQLAKAKGKVNVIAYSTYMDSWRKDGLHELNAAALKEAKAFLEGVKPEGVTSTDTALELAFGIAPQADCFYLFSDGKATHDGKTFIPAKEILNAFEKMNRTRKVQVNTFGFVPPRGEGADVDLMRGLAEATGGTYTEIR